MAARHGCVAQVVVALDVLVPQARDRSACHQAQRQGPDLVHGLQQRALRIAGRRGGEVRAAACGADLRGRQRDQAVVVHAQQCHAAGHVLELAVGLEPGEQLAQPARQGGAQELGVVLNELPDRLDIGGAEVAAAVNRHEVSKPSMVGMSAAATPTGHALIAANSGAVIVQGRKARMSVGARLPASQQACR